MQKKEKCIIFSAPSGSGKSTITKHLLQKFPQLVFSISACSRAPRKGEVDGQDYHFIGLEKFKENMEKAAFLEWEEVYPGQFYGTLRSEVQRIWDLGKIAVFDIDVVGGLHIKKQLGEAAVTCFISVKNLDELKKRLESRATDNPESIQKRIQKAEQEMSFQNQFDYIIENDTIENALLQAEKIVQSCLSEKVV